MWLGPTSCGLKKCQEDLRISFALYIIQFGVNIQTMLSEQGKPRTLLEHLFSNSHFVITSQEFWVPKTCSNQPHRIVSWKIIVLEIWVSNSTPSLRYCFIGVDGGQTWVCIDALVGPSHSPPSGQGCGGYSPNRTQTLCVLQQPPQLPPD